MALTHAETSSARTALLVGVCILLSPLMLFIAAVLYTAVVPAHSAEFYIEEIDTTVALKFYWRWGDTNGDGRFLTVRAPRGRITQDVCGWDWAHWSRTSVYLTPDRKIAVLGPDQCEYLVNLAPISIAHPVRAPSEHWIYLGAFALAGYPRGSRGRLHLRFISAAEQGECVLRGSVADEPLPDSPRERARKRSCPFPPEG
jgi:hypothetical protein